MRRQGHANRGRGTQIFSFPQISQVVFLSRKTHILPPILNCLTGFPGVENRQVAAVSRGLLRHPHDRFVSRDCGMIPS